MSQELMVVPTQAVFTEITVFRSMLGPVQVGIVFTTPWPQGA